jgi:hypothetical protein
MSFPLVASTTPVPAPPPMTAPFAAPSPPPQASDHRTGPGADADRGGVLAFGGGSHMCQRRRLQVVPIAANLKRGEADG